MKLGQVPLNFWTSEYADIVSSQNPIIKITQGYASFERYRDEEVGFADPFVKKALIMKSEERMIKVLFWDFRLKKVQ